VDASSLETVVFGRDDTGADLWCGDAAWLSAEAGRLSVRDGTWWLENPCRQGAAAKAVLRYEHADETVDVIVREGGAAPLPAGGGIITVLAPPSEGPPVRIRLKAARSAAGARGAGTPEPAEGPVRRGRTLPVRPRSREVLDVLAVMTWPLRHHTGLRILDTAETAMHLGLKEDTVRGRLRRYRDQLETSFGWRFTGHLPQELSNLTLKLHFLSAEDDERVLDRWGEPRLRGG
jgi:hypothetical protein